MGKEIIFSERIMVERVSTKCKHLESVPLLDAEPAKCLASRVKARRHGAKTESIQTKGASIPQPMLIKIPVLPLQARCAGFVYKPHQNKAQVPYHLAVVTDHLAVANTQAEKISRPL